MNKTIIININGIVFHIEEDAYDKLRAYMIEVKRHFGHSPDSHEIVGDIENRIAEMFTERLSAGRKEVIVMFDVDEVIAQMGTVSDFGDEPAIDPEYSDHPPYATTQRKLMRDKDDRILGGVCSGLGHYLGIEARWIRLAFLLLFVFWGTGLLLYIILWIVMPVAKTRADRMAMRGEAPNLQNFKRSFQEEMEGLRTNFTEGGEKARTFFDSVGQFLTKIVVFLAKTIGVLFIVGLCIGLIVLLISIFASFEFLGAENNMAMFPINVIEPEIRMNLLISALVVAVIPLIAFLGLIIRIVFERRFMGKYTSFTLLAIWLVAVGMTTVYATRTAQGFQEESTMIEERLLDPYPQYELSLNDIRIIHLLDSQDRETGVRKRIRKINNHNFRNQNLVSIKFIQVDSTDEVLVNYYYSAHGSSYEDASERIDNMVYRLEQKESKLIFDSHVQFDDNELFRDQQIRLHIHIPVGTSLVISNDLRRYVKDLPFRQCLDLHEEKYGTHPDKTSWLMTNTGLKCTSDT